MALQPLRWAYGLGTFVFCNLLIAYWAGTSHMSTKAPTMVRQVLMKKYLPLCWSLPLLARAPQFELYWHRVVALLGALSVFRWYYYYFLSQWFNPPFMRSFNQPDLFPGCSGAGCGLGGVVKDTFSMEAISTHAFCTWDGIGMFLVAGLQILTDGSRLFGTHTMIVYSVLNLIVGPEVVFPLFLADVAKLKSSPTAAFPSKGQSCFGLYICMTLVTAFPSIYAAYYRLFKLDKDAHGVGAEMMSNPSSVRGMILIMVVPFSHLAHILPRYGEENKERKADGWAWLRKFALWNVYLSHVAAVTHVGTLPNPNPKLNLSSRTLTRTLTLTLTLIGVGTLPSRILSLTSQLLTVSLTLTDLNGRPMRVGSLFVSSISSCGSLNLAQPSPETGLLPSVVLQEGQTLLLSMSLLIRSGTSVILWLLLQAWHWGRHACASPLSPAPRWHCKALVCMVLDSFKPELVRG